MWVKVRETLGESGREPWEKGKQSLWGKWERT